MRAILVPHSDIPRRPAVARDATPDAVAHELLDVLDHRRPWNARGPDGGGGVQRPDPHDPRLPRRRRVRRRLDRRRRRRGRPRAACRPCSSASRARRRRSCSRRTSSARSSAPRRARSPSTGGSAPTCAPPCRWRPSPTSGRSAGRSSGCTSRSPRSTRSSSCCSCSSVPTRSSSPTSGKESIRRFHGARHTVLAMLTGFVIGVYDGALGPGTGSFLVFALVGLLGYNFLEASAKAKIANFATNLGALTVFLPMGLVLFKVGVVIAGRQPARRLRRGPDGGGEGERLRPGRLRRHRQRVHRQDRRQPPRLVALTGPPPASAGVAPASGAVASTRRRR